MRTILYIALAFTLALGAALPAVAAEPGGKYLFEENTAKFTDIKKVSSRSYKFLATLDPSKDMQANIIMLRDAVKKAGAEQGYAFTAPKKGEDWRYSEKRYYDTPNKDLYKKGYVIRENYRFAQGEKPDPEKFVLTVKEMSPNDLTRLVNSKLGPVPGSDSLVKFEENISITKTGKLQSYFESAIGSKVKSKDLGERTLGDYGKLYPELLKLGISASTKLVPVTGYSTQLKFGSFALPGGDQAKMDIELWSRTAGGKPFVAEVAFDTEQDEGYATPPAHMKAAEDFFLKVFAKALKKQAMPDGSQFMGSKVRVLFDQKHDSGK